MSINTEMTALADAIRAKSGVAGKLSISGMTSAVSGIVINPVDPGDIDLSVVTVTAADMLKGKVAVNAEGVAITGTIETVSASSDGEKVVVPAGFHAESKEFEIPASAKIDLSFITAGASDILSGKVGADKDGNPVNGTLVVPDLSGVDVTADAILFPYVAVGSDGNPIVGNVQSVKLVVDDNVVTMPKGYSPGESATVPAAAAPTVESNVVTVNKGYQSAEQKITVGTAKAAETVTPGTADQIIPADTYLSGALTVKGEPNWKEENIAEGVSMWGKVGTHKGGVEVATFGYINADGNFQPIDLSGDAPADNGEPRSVNLKMFHTGVPLPEVPSVGEGSMEFYKCASVDTENKTWTGYKAVIDADNVWSFEENVISGLPYDHITPKVNFVYDENCTFRVSNFRQTMPVPSNSLIAYFPLKSDFDDVMGNYKVNVSTATFEDRYGRPAMKATGGTYADWTGTGKETQGALSIFCAVTGIGYSGWSGIISVGEAISTLFGLDTYSSQMNGRIGYDWGQFGKLSTTSWDTIALTRDSSGNYKMYLNGVMIAETTQSTITTVNIAYITAGRLPNSHNGNCYISDFCVYERELTSTEISGMHTDIIDNGGSL